MNKELPKIILGNCNEGLRPLVSKLGFSKNATSSYDKNLKLNIPLDVVQLLSKNHICTLVKCILGSEN